MTKDSLIAELVKALHKARVYVESNARTFGFDSSLQLISEIDAGLSHARAAQSDDWQPIETAPKDGTWFLAFCSDEVDDKWSPIEVVRWRSVGRTSQQPAGFYDSRICRFYPSHWRPLPSPPSKRDE